MMKKENGKNGKNQQKEESVTLHTSPDTLENFVTETITRLSTNFRRTSGLERLWTLDVYAFMFPNIALSPVFERVIMTKQFTQKGFN